MDHANSTAGTDADDRATYARETDTPRYSDETTDEDLIALKPEMGTAETPWGFSRFADQISGSAMRRSGDGSSQHISCPHYGSLWIDGNWLLVRTFSRPGRDGNAAPRHRPMSTYVGDSLPTTSMHWDQPQI